MNISLEDVCHVDEPKTQEMYHFAMNGKSFAVIEEHFPDMLQKVRSLLNESEHHSNLFCNWSGYVKVAPTVFICMISNVSVVVMVCSAL